MKSLVVALGLCCTITACASFLAPPDRLVIPDDPSLPIVLSTAKDFFGIATLTTPNTLGTIDKNLDFALMTMGPNGIESINPVVKGKPARLGDLDSLPEQNILFMRRGMGFYAINTTTRNYGYLHTGAAGNGGILPVHSINSATGVLSIQYYEGGAYMLHLFDLANNRLVLPNQYCFNGVLLPTTTSSFLGMFTDDEPYQWQNTDLGLEEYWDSKLSRRLSEARFAIHADARGFSQKHRFMIGTIRRRSDQMLRRPIATVRWDESEQSILIQELNLQLPSNSFLDPDFVVSPCGRYVKCILYTRNGSGRDLDQELVIFEISDKYPQGVSQPILYGPSSDSNQGAFLYHDTWGPCYVDYSPWSSSQEGRGLTTLRIHRLPSLTQ